MMTALSADMVWIAAACALLIGLSLGLLGGGGSILTVPMFVYLLGLEEKSAIATSLLVVGATSLVALIPHARKGFVCWRMGAAFGGFAMVGALLGSQVGRFVPGHVLLLLFALMMVATAIAMWRKAVPALSDADGACVTAPPDHSGACTGPLVWWKVGMEGVAVGAFTGLVGSGGGFLVVPALMLLGGLSMREAVATSLLVIAGKSLVGFAGYASHVSVDLQLSLGVSVIAALGALLGEPLGRRIPSGMLRRGFAVFVLLMAAYLLVKNVPALWAGSPDEMACRGHVEVRQPCGILPHSLPATERVSRAPKRDMGACRGLVFEPKGVDA